MARFTRIPETNIAGTLGGLVGQSTGTVIGNVNLTTTRLQEKLDQLYKTDSKENNQAKYRELEKIERELNTLTTSITTVELMAAKLESSTNTIKLPISALKIAINIVKYLPLPQMYLITSVSALHSDVIQTLSETVAQIEQIILTLEVIVQIILQLLGNVKARVAALQRSVTALKSSLVLQDVQGLSEHDTDILKNIGILGHDGTNVFEQLASSINSVTGDIIWLGEYGDIDTGSTVICNQVKAAESGTTINVSTGAVGDWVTFAYIRSKEKPKQPAGSILPPKGWSLEPKPGLDPLWKSKGTISGLTGKALSWTEPEIGSQVTGSQVKIVPASKEVYVYKLPKTRFNINLFDLEKANAVILTGPDEAYRMMIGFLQDLDQSPVDPKIKTLLCTDINPQEDQTDPGNTEEWYITKSGERYKMTLKASSVSPKIATLRYVEVTDMEGTVVYEGTQTFATDPKILFEETRVRLTQLLG